MIALYYCTCTCTYTCACISTCTCACIYMYMYVYQIAGNSIKFLLSEKFAKIKKFELIFGNAQIKDQQKFPQQLFVQQAIYGTCTL